MITRFNVVLNKLTDNQLGNIINNCIEQGVNEDDLYLSVKNAQYGRARSMVVVATCAIDLLTQEKTIRHVQEPSEESRLWSSMEGGHIYHELPVIDVMSLTK